ncbi:hypothetical protein V8E53_011671, partial [Lactarius tabidus]
ICAQLNFNPTITLLLIGNEHKFPPRNPNFPQGTVIDTVLTGPVELDFYLIDGIELFSYALCHIYARCSHTCLLRTERVHTRQELLLSASGPGTTHGRIGRRIDGPEPGCEWRWR